jgi:hypothetical protein
MGKEPTYDDGMTPHEKVEAAKARDPEGKAFLEMSPEEIASFTQD